MDEIRCKYCGKPMRWVAVDGKYRPADPDGSPHECLRKRMRRETWVKAHGPLLREKAILDREYRRAVGREP